MQKLSVANPTTEDVHLFICPRRIMGDFSFLDSCGRRKTLVNVKGTWFIYANY